MAIAHLKPGEVQRQRAKLLFPLAVPARGGPKRERDERGATLRECSERWPEVPPRAAAGEPRGASF